jgi:hypothetical protein
MSGDNVASTERKRRRFWRSLRREIRSLPFAVLPAAISYGMLRYARYTEDQPLYAAAFLVMALFSPIVIYRARTLSASVTAAGLLFWTAQSLDGQVSLMASGLFMPLPVVAVFATLSALMCVSNAAFSKRWLVWLQPVIAAVVIVRHEDIESVAFAMTCVAAAVPLLTRLYLKHRPDDRDFRP